MVDLTKLHVMAGPAPVCATCQDEGIVIDEDGRATWCDCERGQGRAQEQRGRQARAAGIPLYADELLQDTPQRQALYGLLRQWYEQHRAGTASPPGVLLWGPPGRGKTRGLATVALALARETGHVRYHAANKLIRAVKASYGGDTPFWFEREIVDPPVLVLDDLGFAGGNLSAHDRDFLAGAIDERYRIGKPILAATNLDWAAGEVGKVFGAGVQSRLQEMCLIVHVLGEDMRSRRAAEVEL